MPATGILIAEYDNSVARELAAHLEGFGYKVLGIACSSEDALARIQQLNPDLVLMNIRLKGTIDGIQTGSLIRSVRNIPIVYLVNTGSQDTIRRAGATEPFGYIFKPFDDRRIFATIETALLRHDLETKLYQSRQWLDTTLTSIGDGVIATDEKDLVRFINPIARELTGWQHAEAIGKSLVEIFKLVDENMQQPVELPQVGDLSCPAVDRRGFVGFLLSREADLIAVEANITFIRDAQGDIHGRVLVFRDVTRQRESLQEIKRRAEQAEALVQVASHLDAHLELDRVLNTICEVTNRTIKASGTVVVLHGEQKEFLQNRAAVTHDPALQAYHGTRFEIPTLLFEGLLSRDRPVIVLEDIQEHAELPFSEAYKSMDIRTIAIAGLFRDHTLVGALVCAFSQQPKTLLEDEAALLKGLADQASSAIENAELFEQVRAGRERQRKLAKSLVDVQETERRRIARELHDHLGQSLTGLQFMLESAKNQSVDAQRTRLENIQEAVTEIIRDVREMSLNLRPSMLDDMGLVPTLLWHIDRYTGQTGIHVNFQYDEIARRMPLEIETAAYRIIQEALTNTARHAHVQEVFVGLVVQDDTLWIEVLDNGRGFDTSTVLDKPSTGLSGMRERASLLGGYLLIESFINQGTQIVAALPLADRPLERRKHERNRSAGR
ncbi:MAG: response regulator [Bacteroidota bacterium]